MQSAFTTSHHRIPTKAYWALNYEATNPKETVTFGEQTKLDVQSDAEKSHLVICYIKRKRITRDIAKISLQA